MGRPSSIPVEETVRPMRPSLLIAEHRDRTREILEPAGIEIVTEGFLAPDVADRVKLTPLNRQTL
jgi:hypothetical protein